MYAFSIQFYSSWVTQEYKRPLNILLCAPNDYFHWEQHGTIPLTSVKDRDAKFSQNTAVKIYTLEMFVEEFGMFTRMN